MKIAFINGALPIPAVRGGAVQTLITALLDENEKNGIFDFTVITPYHKSLSNVEGNYKFTTIIPLKTNYFERIFFFGYKVIRKLLFPCLSYKTAFFHKVNTVLKKNNFDLVIYETSDEGFIQAEHHNNEKIIFHIHADFLNDRSYLINRIKENADYFVCVSDFISGQIFKCGVPKTKIATYKNAIDIVTNKRILAHRNHYRDAIRKQYNLSDSDFVILYCSRLSPEKGVLELIKAVNIIDDVCLLIVGGENFSSNKKTDYLEELEKEVTKSNNRIIFTGYVSHNEVSHYMCAADIAAVPSVCNEAASLTLLEFRSMGLPTIASNRGGIPEYSNSSATKFVSSDEKFIQNLASAILEFKNNHELRASYSECAKKDLSDFSYTNYYKRFFQLIGNLK